MQSFNPNDASELQLFLENPDFVLAQSIAIQLKIANNPETPRDLLAVLVRSNLPEVAEAARLHVNWSGELTGNWQTAIDIVFQTAQLGQNDRLAVELLKIAPVPPAFLSEWVPAKALIQGLSNSYSSAATHARGYSDSFESVGY
ncbi:hypothetical protein [Scytonema sp. NUACC26]|uniref:hypothetical protein n=1 Tax=Scytonema sp. NUACC26 TaxID=3140176 RepID=UPI0034DC9F53